MKIVVNYRDTGIGHQIIDAWNSLVQSRCADYANNVEYVFDPVDSVQDYNVSILCDYMPDLIDITVTSKYDLVLFCNGGEPLEVANPDMREMLKRDNVYLICNGLLTADHQLRHKVIWFPDSVQSCRDYWTRHFYPQYFENQLLQKLPRKQLISCINGLNRINRKYFFDNLSLAVPELNLHSKINAGVVGELLDCQWESTQDTEFRQWVNDNHDIVRNSTQEENYYSQSPVIGIQNKFGSVPPGYFILPMYFESYCVVYPETSWINNQLCVTEKALKCFYSGSLPMPISGARVNQLYNQIGFATAWNLLPPHLQEFDTELDHRKRYQQLNQAIAWLHDNPMVFQSDQFQQLVLQNKMNFLTCSCDYWAVEQFDKLMQKHVK